MIRAEWRQRMNGKEVWGVITTLDPVLAFQEKIVTLVEREELSIKAAAELVKTYRDAYNGEARDE